MRAAPLLAALVAVIALVASWSSPSLAHINASGQPNLVPLPQQWTAGNSKVYVDSQSFNFITSTQSVILSAAFTRYRAILFPHVEHVVGTLSPLLVNLNVTVKSTNTNLQYGIDESYTLSLPSATGSGSIVANTVYGALRGIETFSQLVSFDFDTRTYSIANAPWAISDFPRFSHRGLLVDTSRHFLPVPALKKVLDSMSYAKLNVLHWHIVDSPSFPFESRTSPGLWQGAYSPDERYSQEDVTDVVNYAKELGVRVMPEFDGPGHAASWCTGVPDICPSTTCLEPLDPSNPKTFTVIDNLVGETSGSGRYQGLFPDDFIHFGGDEVNTDCWTNTPHVAAWLQQNNLTTEQAYMYFIEKVHQSAIKRNRNPVNWEEVFNHFGSQLDNETIVHIWLDHDTLSQVVAAGYRGILSNADVWYLDHLDVTWQQFYLNEPHDGITDPKQQALVLGGEVCMWGETVDISDLFNTIWPRAAAAAERLWSARSVNDTSLFEPRYTGFRCLLDRRGIPAAPAYNADARSAPPGPGGCLQQ